MLSEGRRGDRVEKPALSEAEGHLKIRSTNEVGAPSKPRCLRLGWEATNPTGHFHALRVAQSAMYDCSCLF